MGKSFRFAFIIFFLCGILPSFSQNPAVVISSYFNAADPRDEWSELLVLADNTNMGNWNYQDNNQFQTAWQQAITFNNSLFWNNMRAGTVIIIWHRQIGSTGLSHPVDANKADGYIEVSANDPIYFSGGNFGPAPLYGGPTLNIAAAGDLLVLQDASASFVHALGHRAVFGTDWTSLPLPKLNQKSSIASGEAVFVCPGSSLDEYGNLPPQDGTTWTSTGTGAAVTFGLPNTCTTSSTANSDFWRSLRQPGWVSPSLTGTVNAGNTQVTLNWNAAVDPFPGDATQGYLVLRNTSNTFGTPLDGHTYTVGDNLGGASVIAVIPSSQTLSYIDAINVPCPGGLFYQVYSFRYGTDDNNGNDFNVARGRAYNETTFGAVQVNGSLPVAPVTASSDRTDFCADDPGNITLSATGGSGATLNWYTASCGGTLIGAGSGADNSITIPSPDITTTFYARWENTCGNSSCASITVTVLPVLPVSVSITASQNPVCAGASVTFTATSVNPGTTPVYQWKVNGTNTGTNSNTYTYTPSNGDIVSVVLTSNETCTSGNPATSNTIVMSVNPEVPVSVSIAADPGDTICTGTTVTYTATPVNGGTNPSYQWFLNGTSVGGNSPTWSNIPLNGDTIYCKVTSSITCTTNNPATSDTIIMTITVSLPVSLNISTNPGDTICTGTTVTYTATPVNGGTNPSYQWFLNGTAVGGNTPTWSNIPVNGDIIYCKVTSNLTCAINNPATSDTIIMTITASLPVSLNISTNPGDTICTGTTVTYTATPVNGGSNPSYQWFLNGTSVGGNSPTWSNVPVNGDMIYCKVISSFSCATNNPAISDTIIMTITVSLPVSVNIDADPGDTVCTGTTVTYTATPMNGGSNPSYQWFLNGTSVGGNSPTWSNVPTNGDMIYCKVTSSFSCATNNPATSNNLNIVVSSGMPVSVGIAAVPGDTICSGTTMTFTATPVNGGPAPVFQWYLNGTPVGSNNPVYSVTPADGDAVYCIVTSSLTCAITNPASSNTITVTYITALNARVTISANHTALCPGTVVTFTASPLNEGTSPIYEWLVNGVSVQLGSSPVYTTNALTGGESVVCRLTSSLSCIVANPVESTPLSIPAAPAPVVKLTDKAYLCAGEPSQLDAGAGFTTYFWQDGSTGRYFTATNEGMYHVTVTDSLGCTASDSVLMKVCDALMFVPDAFTPNGDGLNDEFKAVTSLEGITSFSMRVYNRWGEMVFESSDIHHGWNGIVKGKYASPDTYVWKIIFQISSQANPSTSSTTLHGTVTLIR